MNNKDHTFTITVAIAAVILGGTWWYMEGADMPLPSPDAGGVPGTAKVATREELVLPREGVTLPVVWGDLGVRLVETGVIDAGKFNALYANRGELTQYEKNLLEGRENKNLVITERNVGFVLNLLWALGLGAKSDVLENGPMMTYGGDAGRFASTGGWTLAQGSAMDHYSRHSFFTLTAEQAQLVARVSSNIYRPCCDNPTHFPDCNHGMAMLGLLELMASQGIGEEEMYRVALAVNAYWFPDTYRTIAQYMESQGVDWEKVDPKEILGQAYSSGSGYQRVLAEVETPVRGGGGSCGV